MLPLLALLVQAVTPPKVTIQTVVVPRAAGTVVARPARVAARPATFDIDVRGDGVRVWSGVLRPATDMTATFTETIVNAPPTPCPATVNRYDAGYRTSLRLNVQMLAAGPDGPFRLTASWERPDDDRDCDNLSAETISKSETFSLAVGQHHQISADGGLEIGVTRRQ